MSIACPSLPPAQLMQPLGPGINPLRRAPGATAMSERYGVGIAILSCCFGAGAAVATRYLIGAADALTLAAMRFGAGALCLAPLVLLLPVRWPRREDWPAVAALGFVF